MNQPTEIHPTTLGHDAGPTGSGGDLELSRALEAFRQAPPGETPEKKAGRLLFIASVSPWRKDLDAWLDLAAGMERATELFLRTALELVPQAATIAELNDAGLAEAHGVLLAIPIALGRDLPAVAELQETAAADLQTIWDRLGPRVEATDRARAEQLADVYDRAAACFAASRRCLEHPPQEERALRETRRIVHALGILALVPRLEARDLAALEPARLLDLLDEAARPTPFDEAATESLADRFEPAAEASLARAAAHMDEHRAYLHVLLRLLVEKPDDRAVDFLLDAVLEHKRCNFAELAGRALVRIGPASARRLAERFDAIHADLPDAVGLVQALAHPSLLDPVRRAYEAGGQLGFAEALERLYRTDGISERPDPDLARRLEEIRSDSPEAIETSLELGMARLPRRVRVHLVCWSCGRSFVQDLVRLYVLNPMIGNLVEDFFYPEDLACPWCRKVGGHPIDPAHVERLQKYFLLLRRLGDAGADMSSLPFRFVSIAPPQPGQEQQKSALGTLWAARQGFYSPGAAPAAGIAYARLLASLGEKTRSAAVLDQVLATGRLATQELLASAQVLRDLGHGDRARDIERRVAPSPAPGAARNVGRNDPCPCGSGKKYKKCCLRE